MLEEQNCLKLTSEPVPKLNKAHARKYKPLLHCTESHKCDSIEIFCIKWEINVTAEFS